MTDRKYAPFNYLVGRATRNPEESTTPKGTTVVKLYIDHDHDTGAPRKLLCAMCNTGLGRFRDNLDRLRKAVAYMESFSVGEE